MSTTRRNSHLVDIDKAPTHHSLQPGDWWQFIRDEPLRSGDGGLIGTNDFIYYQFHDEAFERRFRVTAVHHLSVYECVYDGVRVR